MIVNVLFVSAAVCSIWTGALCNGDLVIGYYETPKQCQAASDLMSEVQGGKGNIWPHWRGFSFCEQRYVPGGMK